MASTPVSRRRPSTAPIARPSPSSVAQGRARAGGGWQDERRAEHVDPEEPQRLIRHPRSRPSRSSLSGDQVRRAKRGDFAAASSGHGEQAPQPRGDIARSRCSPCAHATVVQGRGEPAHDEEQRHHLREPREHGEAVPALERVLEHDGPIRDAHTHHERVHTDDREQAGRAHEVDGAVPTARRCGRCGAGDAAGGRGARAGAMMAMGRSFRWGRESGPTASRGGRHRPRAPNRPPTAVLPRVVRTGLHEARIVGEDHGLHAIAQSELREDPRPRRCPAVCARR